MPATETLRLVQEEELPITERQMSFDPLASISMMRFDIEHFGEVLEDTKNRIHDEELSFLAEGADQASHTPFAFRREGDELLYFNRGKWQPHSAMLQTGLDVARKESAKDSRRSFLLSMAANDRLRGMAMSKLKPGEQMSWTSSFRHDIAQLYGDQFMNSCGFNAERKMGFIYQATGTEEGVLLESQTVDLSDPDAFAAVEAMIEAEPDAQLEDLVSVHDEVLGEKFGKPHFAGRADTEPTENAWEAVLKEEDLVEYLLEGLEKLAHQTLQGVQLEKATKRHIYGVWAAFKERLDGNQTPLNPDTNTHTLFQDAAVSTSYKRNVAAEVQRAFDKFVDEGRVLIGCGGSISIFKGEDDIMNASAKDVHSAIFGEKPCKEIKNGQATTCPGCKEKVKAIVPNRTTIYCPNYSCKLAAPGLRRTVKLSGHKADS